MRRVALALLLPLVACAQTRDSCEQDVAREIRRLDALIVETRTDLARGYRYETEYRRSGVGLVLCSGRHSVRFCTATDDRPVRRAVAVDPAAEQRKLDLLEARRMRLAREGAAACAARYPEG